MHDVVVVGGGIAGMSVAYELASDLSIMVLEMEDRFGAHSTGRSAAVLAAGGELPVQMLVEASRRFFEARPDDFVEPLLHPRPMIWVASQSDAAMVNSHMASIVEFAPDVHLIDPAEAVRLCPVLDPAWVGAGLLEPTAADINVHGLHQGFIRGLHRRGGSSRINSRVVELVRERGTWRVTTATGEQYEAPIIINAAGSWGDEIAHLAGVEPVGLQPLLRNAFVAAQPHVPDGYTFRNLPLVHEIAGGFYFKPEGDVLLCSPADELPSAACDARSDETSIAAAIDRINAATFLNIRHVQRSWAGLRSFVADRVPIACFDPQVEGFFWLVGQGGFGIETSPALARSAAALAMGRELPADLRSLGLLPAHLDRRRLVTKRS
jgi:D-arginine dehydrogenase